jgi:hypothetical protein
MIRSWWGIGFPSYDNIVRIGMDTRTGSADFTGNVNASGEFRKVGGASGTNFIRILGNDAHSPYIEFLTASTRRAYIGYATATTMDFFSAGGATLRLGSENVSRMTIATDGSMTHTAGDNSYMRYGPNTGPTNTWNANLIVGASVDRSGAATAQVIATNGNLHMDAGNGLDMYYGYYPWARSTPNVHRFYGNIFINNSVSVSVNLGVGINQPITKFNVVAGESVFNGNVYLNNNANIITPNPATYWGVGVRLAGEDNGWTGSDFNVYVSWQGGAWYRGFRFDNTGRAYNFNNSWGGLSDVTMKENIIDARNYLDDVRLLRVVKYSLKVDKLTAPNQLGLIAQEVEAIFPSLVSTDKDGIKYLKTSIIGMIQLKSIQELADKNDALEAANAATSSQMAALHGTCASLQAANAATSSQMAALHGTCATLQQENAQLKSQMAALLQSQASLIAWAQSQGYSS